MGNLEKPRHGWEGFSNGGEIYGNQQKQQSKPNQTDIKLETFNDMLNKGMDRIMAYQIVYNLNFQEAEKRAAQDNYNNLISCGLPHEMAKAIAYKTKDDNLKSK